MIKIAATLMLATLLALVGISDSAYAHTLKIDGDIGITLHSDPNDDLIAGQITMFSAVIQDRTGRFQSDQPASCECQMTITKDGVDLRKVALTYKSTSIPVGHTFKEGGVYDVTVSGTPKTLGAFQPFSATFSSYVKSGDAVHATGTANRNALRTFFPFVTLTAGVILLLFIIDPTNIRRKNLQ